MHKEYRNIYKVGSDLACCTQGGPVTEFNRKLMGVELTHEHMMSTLNIPVVRDSFRNSDTWWPAAIGAYHIRFSLHFSCNGRSSLQNRLKPLRSCLANTHAVHWCADLCV
jgi:hypothetical protein